LAVALDRLLIELALRLDARDVAFADDEDFLLGRRRAGLVGRGLGGEGGGRNVTAKAVSEQADTNRRRKVPVIISASPWRKKAPPVIAGGAVYTKNSHRP